MSSPQPLVSIEFLVKAGLSESEATKVLSSYRLTTRNASEENNENVWMRIASSVLRPQYPFSIHTLIRDHYFGRQYSGLPPLWYPNPAFIANTCLFKFMTFLNKHGYLATCNFENIKRCYSELQLFAVEEVETYWTKVIEFMKIEFCTDPEKIIKYSSLEDEVIWFPGSCLNIAEIALNKIMKKEAAIVWQDEISNDGALQLTSGKELKDLSFRIAAAISKSYESGSNIAVYMPMTVISVAIYLGIILAGCTVVSIADSFAAPEVKSRLEIANSSVIFTQDVIARAGKVHPLYQKLKEIDNIHCIVLSANAESVQVNIQQSDVTMEGFLGTCKAEDFNPVICAANSYTNILFSSGTTGKPKAIPWTHLTPLKCGVDGMFCQNINESSIVCWPTNLGWMMGPWLLFGSFLNGASVALYQGSPLSASFCKFVESCGVTMLGVIPSLVRQWKQKNLAQNCDWSQIQCFSSTGEASSYEEYHWLMSRAGYKPIIEYCGGTEIGGAYITGNLLSAQTPSAFTNPVLGSAVVVLHDGCGSNILDKDEFIGELAIAPPALGLSQCLLNKNHMEVYYDNMPRYGKHEYRLRRHGDVFAKSHHGFYFSRGRADDTMNLGGIKVSCVELEYAVMSSVVDIKEAAAVSYAFGGPEELAIFVVAADTAAAIDINRLKYECQMAIRTKLNPLFKVSRVVIKDILPRNASNKITRNTLRSELQQSKL